MTLDVRAERYRGVTEKAWMADVAELAEHYGWAFFHVYDSRRSAAGWPDVVMVRPPRIVLAELKTERGVLTKAQRAWLDLLDACPGVETHEWRPSQVDQVHEVLR